MPRYYPNTRFSDCWSSVGNVTFYHRNDICYFRSKPYSNFKGTAEQNENLDLQRRAIRAWQGLDHRTQLIWRALAVGVEAHRPPFDRRNHISGYNLFVSSYHGFAQLGHEHVPEPQPFEHFPVFSMDFLDTEDVDGGNLKLRFRLSLYGTEDFQRYRVMGKIQLTSPGLGRNPGLMRNYLSDDIPSGRESTVNFVIPDYAAVSGFSLDMYQIHMRYLLLDARTGYRSQYQTLSTLARI